MCVIFLAALVASAPARAQKQKEPLPDADRRALLLQEAASLTNIWSSNSTSWHMRATITSFNDKKRRKGTLEIWWAGPSRFRDQITWGDQPAVTRIADGDKLWIDGDDLHRRDTFRVMRLLGFPAHLMSVDGKSPRASRRTIDGQPALCLDMNREFLKTDSGTLLLEGREYHPLAIACVDPATNLPREINETYRYELSDYVAIGHNSFPRKLATFVDGPMPSEIASITVEILEPLDLKTASFAPRDGVAAEPWCANAAAPKPLTNIDTNVVAVVPGAGVITTSPVLHSGLLVLRVDASGIITSARAFDSDGEAKIPPKLYNKFTKAKFAPAACNGSPIPGEYLDYNFFFDGK